MNLKGAIDAFSRLGLLAAFIIGVSIFFGGSANAQGTTFTWTNVGGGNFDVPANWSPNGVPGPNDTALFNSNFTYTVNGSRTVNSIVIAGSTVAFTGNITTSNLSVTTSGGGLIVFSGNFTLNGPGNIDSGSILTLTGGTLAGTGTLTLNGTSSWANTNLAGSFVVASGATMTTTGAGDHPVSGTLTNRGTLNVDGGRVTNGSISTVIQNEGLVDVRADLGFIFTVGAQPNFINTASGTLRRSVGTGNLDFNWNLNNSGTVEVQTGRFRMTSSTLTNSGALSANNGTVFEFSNANAMLSPGSSLNGVGRFVLTNGTVTVGTGLSVGNLDLVGGTLAGTGTVTVTGGATWTSTIISGRVTIDSGAVCTTMGNIDRGLSGILTVQGTFNFQGGRITNGGGSGTFRNQGLVDLQADGSIVEIGSGVLLLENTPSGIIRKTGGAGNFDFSWPGSNAGLIEVQSGRVRIQRNFMNTGALTVTGGTQVVEFANSTTTLSTGTTLNGDGRFQISTATLNAAAPVDVPRLDLMGGTLSGSGGLRLTADGTWTSTNVSGLLTVASPATLEVLGTVDRGLSGTLTNQGVFNFREGRITNFGGPGIFRNEGVFDAKQDVSVVIVGSSNVSFVNVGSGIIRKTGGSGPLAILWPLTNQGTIECPRDFRVDAFTQASTGILNVDISGTTPATQYDRLQANSVTLSGTLNLSVSNGFTPALGQTFDIITFNARTGTIPTVNGKNQGPVAFDPVYLTGSPSSLRLNVINSPCPTITLDPQTLPNLVNGVAYNQTVTATGGTAPYNFVVTSGSLPNGLTLSTAGVISGTPTVNGTFTFQITATDANGCNGFINYTVNVACPTITLSPMSLPNGSVAVMYSQTISASGGLGNYTFMPVSGLLPPGLVLSGAGVLAGMPTAQGTYQFTVRATDTVTGCFGDRVYTVIIGCPTITLSGLGNGTVGMNYSQTVTANGGTAPYSFSFTGGTLPTGLSLASSGALTGTPTVTGNFTFTVTATDANGCTGSSSFTVNIGCQTITVNPATLPDGNIGAAYSQMVSATNGQGTVTFSVTSGGLPTGLNLNGGTGAISGTPTATGTFDFTITATDGNGCTGSRGYTVVVTCPTISLSGLPNATVGQSYTQTITASAGTAPYSFSLASGSLPTGLSLDPNGTVSGTPTAAGSFTFTVTATDGNGCTGSRSYTVVANCQFVTLSPATLPSATVGSSYSQTISASGGSAPYTFAVTNGTLPATFSLSTGGVLSGNPTATGSATFTVTATDANGCTGALVYTLNINPAGACTYTVSPQSLSFPSSGGIGRVTVTTDSGCSFTTSGAPAWITGLTPTGTGTQTLTFTVAANNDTTPRTATLTIAGQTVTVSQAAAVNLNDSVRLSVISQGLVPSTCAANGYVGDFVIQASLTNIGRFTIYHGAFLLTQLRPANGSTPAVPFRLISADGATCTSGGLPGALQTVNFGAGLAPGESVNVTFVLSLSTIQRTIFNVQFQGGSDTPVARAKNRRATPSPASQISGGVVDFAERSLVENRKKNGYDLTLDTNFVLPQREVSKPSGL